MKRYLFILLCCLPFVGQGQVIETVAGNGLLGNSGDGDSAIAAKLYQPGEIFVDRFDNLFIIDANNHKIRKVNLATGIITSYAGTGTSGYAGDGGLATNAQLNAPAGMAGDSNGNLYFADGNHVIRKIDAATGIITTVAGNGTAGFSGDGGPATQAQLYYAGHIAFDSLDNMYIADVLNRRIRKVDASGTITTIAGNGTSGYSGDGGIALSAQIASPHGIACDAIGNIFFTDDGNSRIRKVTVSTGLITTFAGNGTYGYTGDGVLATSTSVAPEGIAFDQSGNLFLADRSYNRVRKVDQSGIIHTVAGNGTAGYNGDFALAVQSQLNGPHGVSLDSCGNLYIGDNQNKRVRKVTFNPNCFPLSFNTPTPLTFTLSPNPATSRLTITSNTKLKHITVTNALGQIVLQQNAGFEKTVLDVTRLQGGIYFLTVTDVHGGKRTERIVITP